MWVGIDDTDSPRGGCTTWVLTELLALARDEGVDLLGEPRLVRLNPNVPWKTRGNAALCARFGRGRGRRRILGNVDGRPIFAYAAGSDVSEATAAKFADAAWNRVLEGSRTGDPRTDPALVAVHRKLPASLYYEAVRSVISVADRRRFLERCRAIVHAEGDGRGLVGASSAIAWPGRRATWELIAYRPRAREAARREVDAASVRTAAERHPGLFLCHDPRTRRLLVTPHTPCPILFGLRGRDPESPVSAFAEVRSEPVDRWVLFRTNQGTGDHLQSRRAKEIEPFGSARVVGRLAADPEALRGGHVRVRLRDLEGTVLEAVAFEPTKTLPRVLQQLRTGDRVELWGSRGTQPVLRLEGVRIDALVPRWSRASPPRCPQCGKATRSLGTLRGFRCGTCHRRFPPEAARPELRPAEVQLGAYYPTPSARRHLAPLGPEP